MKQWRRFFLMILINALVSICSILLVLIIWDKAYGPLPKGILSRVFAPRPTSTLASLVQVSETPQTLPLETQEYIIYQVQPGDTFESLAEKFNVPLEVLVAVNGFSQVQPLGEGEVLRIPLGDGSGVVIETVIGAGILDVERVKIKYPGPGEVSLTNWRLESQNGQVFVFPSLVLFSGGAVNVYTKRGTNTVVDLYWGLDAAIWSPGTTVTLRDAQGVVRATYQVP